jgi:hypothetical protein
MSVTTRALAFVSRWFDEATVRRVFEPLVADWQREWLDASPSQRRRVSVRGFFAFVCATIVSSPGMLRARAPQAVTDRIAVRVARFTLLASTLLFVPLSRELDPAWATSPWILFLVPGLLTLAFPFAMIGAVDTIRTEGQLSPQAARSTTLKLAMLAMTLMLAFSGWVLPAANQAWRVAMNPHRPAAPARGVRELTTWELVAHPERATASEHARGSGRPISDQAARADGIRRELNSRASLIVLPVLLLWRRWSALDLAPGRWYSPLPSWLATLTMLFGFLFFRFQDWFVEQVLNLPAGSAAWLPLLILLAAGTIRGKWAHRLEARA